MRLLVGQPPQLSGRDDPVTKADIRGGTYLYTSRVVDAAWEPFRVKEYSKPIEDFLAQCTDRTDFELRCWALEVQTTNLGLHPLQRNPARLKEKNRYDDSKSAGLPSVGKLVADAASIHKFLI